jgi:hypothetical protein
MPWWFWTILWIALVALSLAYVLLLGIKAWRDFTATAKSLEDAGSRLDRYRREKAAEVEGRFVADAGSPGAAVFASPEQMKDDYTAAKAARVSSRRRRRFAGRAERGQPQSLRDIELHDMDQA